MLNIQQRLYNKRWERGAAKHSFGIVQLQCLGLVFLVDKDPPCLGGGPPCGFSFPYSRGYYLWSR